MRKFKKPARFLVALLCLSAAFFLSIQLGDRGVQFDLRHSDGAASAKEGAAQAYDLSALRILNRVLLRLKDSYVEPERVAPQKMLVSALDEIQNSIAEVVVTYDRRATESPDEITVKVNEQSRTFDIGGIRSLWEMSFKLKEIFGFIQATLGEDPDVEYRDIEYAAINGMLDTLDPHSTLLPPKNYKDMQTQTGGKFGGLGIFITVRDGTLTVISPIDGTPAAKKGIKSRDKIVRIGEESTVNMNLREAVNMMRGEPGTTVTLWVTRKGWDEPRKFVVERAIIKIESVTSEPLSDKIGYLRIKNFQANTFADTKRHLKQLREQMGGVQGLILDLRDNPGGLLDQSIRISDLFINEGALVSTVGKGNKLREKKMAMRSGTEPDYPIVVLVNSGSASASEIVSGAIQNNERGIVVGDTTFGKGSVQVIYEFPDKSALKLTVAQYLTPGDVSIQGRGIAPDLRTVPVVIEDEEIDLFQSKNITREGDLATALTNEAADERRAGQRVRFLRQESEPADEFASPDAFTEDFEIRLAQRLLRAGGSTWKRDQMLEAVQPALADVAARESEAIREALKERRIDWTAGPSPSTIDYDFEVTTSLEGDAPARAGETIKLTASFTNTGEEPLYQLRAITEGDNPALVDQEFLFGKVEPGQTRTWSLDVKLPRDMDRRTDLMHFELSDANTTYTSDATAPQLALTIEPQPRPHFAFSYRVLDPSGDGLFQAGEEIRFKVIVHNTGQADSAETLVYVKNLARESLYLEKGRARLESIPAGGKASAEFVFDVKKAPLDGDQVELELDIYDSTFREFTQKTLSFPYLKADPVVLDETTTGVATITAPSATLRGGAHEKTPAVGQLQKGDQVPVTGAVGDWWRVDGEAGPMWLPAQAASLEDGNLADAQAVTPTLFESPKHLPGAGRDDDLRGLRDPQGPLRG